MSFSQVTYPGTGASGPFPVPFPYLLKSHVIVTIDGAVQTSGAHYTWPTDSSILFTSPVTAGAVVKFQRVSSPTDRLVDHKDAGVLTEDTLDADALQMFYLIQEAADYADSVKVVVENTASLFNSGVQTIEAQVATAGQTVFTLTTPYVVGTNNLNVYVNGIRQRAYTETSNTVVTFASGLTAGAVVEFIVVNPLANGASAGVISYDPQWTGATIANVGAKLRRAYDVMDRGAVNDKTTDNTASILAAAIAASAAGIELLTIPYGVKFNTQVLLSDPTFPTNVRLLDYSGVNGYQSAGESNFTMGVISKDAAEDDTHWAIKSGHHPVLQTNNTGTAGTTSALSRLATWLWTTGHHLINLAANKIGGYRTAAMAQWRLTAEHTWEFVIRSLAPGVSIEGDYEFWSDTENITVAGKHRVTDVNHYVSAGAVPPGSGMPTHLAGTVGNWTYLDSSDRGVIGVDQHGRVLIGTGAYGDTFTHRVSSTDPNGSYVFKGIAKGLSKSANLRLTGTNSSGAEVEGPYFRADASSGTPVKHVMKSDSSAAIVTFTDSNGVVINAQSCDFLEYNSGATTADLTGRYVVLFTHSSPISIVGITLPERTLVECHFINSNVTFVNSSSLKLTGSSNATMTDGSVITFRRYPNSVSSRVVEVSRSIK